MQELFWFIIGAALSASAAFAMVYIINKNSNQKLFLGNVTDERSKWRQTLRNEVAEFCALASKHYYDVHEMEDEEADAVFSANIYRLNELRVKVRLKLNPHELIDSFDTKLIRSMSRVIIQFESKQYSNINRELLRIERCAQRILKSEWDKSKKEAESGLMFNPRN